MWESSLARDVMVTQLITVRPDDLVLDCIDLLLQSGISGAPVVDDDGTYLGTFSEKCCWQTLVELNGALAESDASRLQLVSAKDIMRTRLLTFSPDTDTLVAADQLVAHRVSGGPVVDSDGMWVGSFSEHTAMKALLDMAMHQTPPGTVSSYMDRDEGRVVAPGDPLEHIVEEFQDSKFRRFPVVDHGRLVGQISRRDVLQAALGWLVDSVENDPQGLADHRQTTVLRSGQSRKVKDICSNTAATVEEDFDLLRIVRLFHDTSARRLPVLRGNCVIGQVSRRDVLKKAIGIFPDGTSSETPQPLYLSSSGGAFPGSN